MGQQQGSPKGTADLRGFSYLNSQKNGVNGSGQVGQRYGSPPNVATQPKAKLPLSRDKSPVWAFINSILLSSVYVLFVLRDGFKLGMWRASLCSGLVYVE